MAGSPPPAVRTVDEPPDQELLTGEAVALDVAPAGFILRAAGALIDWAAYFALFGLLVLAISSVAGGLDSALATALSTASLVFAIVVVPIAVELGTRGRSLGKLAVGARIVRDDGGGVQFRHVFIRALSAVVEIVMTAGGLAAIVALLNGRAKRVGDFLAGTYSQRERVPAPREVGYPLPPELTEWARTADVARLPDGLARRVASFLTQAGHMTVDSRSRLAGELANEVSAYVAPLPATDAERLLGAVTAVRRDREYAALLAEQNRLARLDPVLHGLPHGFPER